MASKSWGWIGKYVIVIIVALLLGIILGNLALFKNAALGNPKLTAALLVEFIAHVAALMLLWTLGWRIAEQMRGMGSRQTMVATIVLALVSLVITAVTYTVLSHFINPFVSNGVKEAVKWICVLGVFATASWFVLALFAGGEALLAVARDAFAGPAKHDA